MKKIVLVIFGMAFVSAACLKSSSNLGSFSPSPTPSPTPTAIKTSQGSIIPLDDTWNLYTNNTYHYSVKLPKKVYGGTYYSDCNSNPTVGVREAKETMYIVINCKPGNIIDTAYTINARNDVADQKSLTNFLHLFTGANIFKDENNKTFNFGQSTVFYPISGVPFDGQLMVNYSGAPNNTVAVWRNPKDIGDVELPTPNGQGDYVFDVYNSFQFIK